MILFNDAVTLILASTSASTVARKAISVSSADYEDGKQESTIAVDMTRRFEAVADPSAVHNVLALESVK